LRLASAQANVSGSLHRIRLGQVHGGLPRYSAGMPNPPDHRYKPETLAIHAGQIPDAATGARALPIYQTTSFVFDSAEHAASLFNLQTFGNVYSRLSNPTVAALEERVAALEDGRAAVACASGMAAEACALMTILQSGDHVVAAGALYGGSVTMLAVSLKKFGIETTFVDVLSPGLSQADAFAAAMRPNTRAVFAESLGNPSLVVLDIAAVADVAHAHGVPLVIDNTVPSPFLCNPLALGADIVVHSATKYLAGHGTTLGGVVVEGGKFPWDNGKFPGMTEPSAGYHGVKFFETFGDFAFAMRARMETLRVFGAALSPMSAWLILQGVETLPLRMERHCSNACKVAEFLRGHPAVAWVNYPGLPDHPQHALLTRQMTGASGLLAFGVKGGVQGGVTFIENAQFMSHLVNIGDIRTLISHPASTTHRQLDAAQQLAAGVRPDMVRISVGLEHIDDILWDIDQALVAAQPLS
jgi:O-acetylhomoserine (thiol)-lyase